MNLSSWIVLHNRDGCPGCPITGICTVDLGQWPEDLPASWNDKKREACIKEVEKCLNAELQDENKILRAELARVKAENERITSENARAMNDVEHYRKENEAWV